ncbi:uncharacterized protein LOC6548366 isoform X1 [Drosophila erecta]|uniref:Uncharacterized protein, isoform A n=1 Tax=Drosophila erecta TaxID=7220 RepID=B3NQV9_DROER|nr:uncharacterized protein LOC6548366 isoform X1 [Drosophila erecta]EDV57042.1 uncharacterized protein Dere_GG19910, isoform A [Drosophila erecta]
MAPAISTTTSTPISSTASVVKGTLNTTESASSVWQYENTTPVTIWINDGGYDGPFMFFYPSYVIYIVLVFLFVIAFPLAMIMSAKRKREANARNLAQQRQRARRQMEINVTNNCNGGSGGAGNVCSNRQDEVSVLPKTLDLPPSYDEAAFSERKQDSTLTIATNLEASNPNLAAGTNEPPPVYEANVATTTTSTTTTVFLVNGQPPVV